MADKKPSYGFITPRGAFIFPKLTEPDTKFKPEGEFRVKLRLKLEAFAEKDVKALSGLLEKQTEETKADLKAKKEGAKLKALKVRDLFVPETDKETGDETGFVIVNAKMVASGIAKKTGKPWTRAPKLFDAGGKKLKAGVNIWGGTEGKLAIEARAYYTPKDNEVGVAYYLEAAQILKLVTAGDKDAAGYGFGVEEGYTDEPDEGGEQFADSEASNAQSGPAGSGDDF